MNGNQIAARNEYRAIQWLTRNGFHSFKIFERPGSHPPLVRYITCLGPKSIFRVKSSFMTVKTVPAWSIEWEVKHGVQYLVCQGEGFEVLEANDPRIGQRNPKFKYQPRLHPTREEQLQARESVRKFLESD